MYEKLLRNIVKLNRWRKRHISQGAFLIIAAAIVGVMGGLAASFLKILTHLVARFLQDDFHWEYKYLIISFFPLLGIFLAVLYVKTFIRRRPFYKSIPPIIKSIHNKKSKLDFHNIYSQIITSALTVGLGGSAGLESPAVYSGAAIGSNLGRVFGLNYKETTLLLACGGAAGIAGAFNGPIAGMAFAVEVLLPTLSIAAFIPLLISAAVASVISSSLNSEPLFAYIPGSGRVDAIWIYIIFGILAGLYTVYFSYLNELAHRYFKKIRKVYHKVWIGGISMGLLVAVFPAIYGEGYIGIQKLLNGDYQSLLSNSLFHAYSHYSWLLLAFAFFTLVAKTFGSVITMSSGGNGGMFGPSVVVGGLMGFVFAFGLNQTGWIHLNTMHFMIVGMAAAVSGIMHAPLTGVFLSAEITGGYVLMVPLMMVSAIAYFINKGIRKYSIYTKELVEQGDLHKSNNQDESVLIQLKVKYVLENDFVVLSPKDTPLSRRKDIIHSNRDVFPVVDSNGKFLGKLNVEDLLEHILNPQPESDALNISIGHLVQPTIDKVKLDAPMDEVLRQMDKSGERILPVVDESDRYLGFISKARIFTKYRKLLLSQSDSF